VGSVPFLPPAGVRLMIKDRTSQESGMVGLIGLPLDRNSSFLRGSADAPARIRELLQCGSGNSCCENGLDLGTATNWRDHGDLDLERSDDPFGLIEDAVSILVDSGTMVVALGGDHSVTLPLLRVHARRHPGLNVLHLDAHADIYDELEGNRYSHACPMLRALEEGLIGRLVQAGIRTLRPVDRERAAQYGVEVVEMRHWDPGWLPTFDGPVYLSLDLDCLDPAFAPGVSHHEPGGFSTRDVIRLIQQLDQPLLGADLVELNPRRDPSGITAMAAVNLLKEILGKMLVQ
jgi:arginase